MIDKHSASGEYRPRLRRVAVSRDEHSADVALLERAVAASLRDSLEWEGEVSFASPERAFDRSTFEQRLGAAREMFGGSAQRTLELHLQPGAQFIAPAYDEGWGVGAGWPLAHWDGGMLLVGEDGFSASGFGFYLEADEDGLVSISPQGTCDSHWASLDDYPRLHSKSGGGVVVYDGSTLDVSRQPILWDVRSPTKFTGQRYVLPFGAIATPPLPGTFGTVPLAPVLAPIRAGGRLLVWFYMWHLGVNMKDTAFIPFATADVPLVTTTFGKGPIVN